MGETYLLNRPWLVAIIWVFLYGGDYYLTIWGAKLFRRQPFTEIEGSYELNPRFQDDIDKLRPVSRRFVLFLVLTTAYVLLVGCSELSRYGYGYVYSLVVGSMFFLEIFVWMRHWTNVFLFRRLLGPDPGVEGHLRWRKYATYRTSGEQALLFAVFTGIVFVLTGCYMLLGGTVAMLAMAARHQRLARRVLRKSLDAEDDARDEAKV